MIKNINQNPKITDQIRFLIETTNVNECLVHPYKINYIKIYFLERSYLDGNFGEYKNIKLNEKLVESLKMARQIACQNPTQQNIFEVNRLQNELIFKSQSSTFYYNNTLLVEQIGNENDPAWFSNQPEDSLLQEIYDENNNLVEGSFTYDWQPKSKVREGDFFICWNWTPNIAGESISNHQYFTLLGDGKAVQSLPTHITPDGKYYTLLEKYLPEMYKSSLTDDDITPEVTHKLNKAVAQGFTFIEDLANQLIDLYDSNVLHESLILYLSNLFNLRLKSNDPTLWRRQIKEAVPLFKKKGTITGLKEAFSQSGIFLDKFTSLWQVISPYTWQQSFLVEDSPYFKLDKKPIDKIQLWIRRDGQEDYIEFNIDNIDFEEIDCQHYIVWVGDEKSISPINIYKGDSIRLLYQYTIIPTNKESVELYIRSLPLADNRKDENQYPLKNWNVRLIEADDPMFDVIIPNRHPFQDNLIFGKIRTEFPYSENIYNMETYNGSQIDSYDPCYIDKNFRDPCGSCLSSKYNIDITISELSDDRLKEVYDILNEYTPFTSVLNQINFKGEICDFVNPGVEEIDFLIQFNLEEYVISGESNPFFHRVMEDGLTKFVINREDLARQVIKVSNKTGTAYNTNVSFISPNVHLENIGLIKNNHILEILSPSANSGIYKLNKLKGNTAAVTSTVSEPLSNEVFTFKLSNIVLDSNVNIFQENCNILQDNSVSLYNISIKTLWDVDNTPDYTGGAWKIYFPLLSKTVEIDRIYNNKIYLLCNENINVGNYNYILLDDNDNEILNSICSIYTINRGRISFNDPNINTSEFIRHGDYLLYNDVEYLIDELKINNDVIANNYNEGEVNNTNVKFLRRLASNEIGYFVYQGMQLMADFNHEAEFSIQNGLNYTNENLLDNNNFKENFLVNIQENYYKIEQINGNLITLGGIPQDWGTLNSGGTMVNYSIHQFLDKTVEVQFTVFDKIDRSGQDPVIREIESTVTNDVAIIALSANAGNGMEDIVNQNESIGFEIEYINGEKEQGEI